MLTNGDQRQRKVTGVLLVALIGLLTSHLCVFGQDRSDEYLPVIATSGDVDIESIRISRWRASGQAKSADLIHMELSLWLTSKSDLPERMLMQVVELDPIHDNTGKLLTTKQRLDALPFWKKEFRGESFKEKGERTGPVINLVLDAPAREATSIKSIKGKAVVSDVVPARIDFTDLKAINKKVLEDPKLKDFKLEPQIEVSDGDTEVKLLVPENHARLVWWGLVTKARKTVPYTSEGRDSGSLTKTYQGDQTKDTFLGIVIADPVKTRELEFHFKDVELP